MYLGINLEYKPWDANHELLNDHIFWWNNHFNSLLARYFKCEEFDALLFKILHYTNTKQMNNIISFNFCKKKDSGYKES